MYELYLNGTKVKQVWVVGRNAIINSPMRVANSTAGASITVTLTKIGTPHDLYLEYSTDNTDWHVWNPDSNGNRTASVANNGNFYIRGENPLGFYVDDNNRYSFDASGKYALAGNLNAWYSKYESDSLPANCFRKLFYQSTNLDNISYVMFSATRLGDHAYEAMFSGCTGLRLAPHCLPATRLGNYVYLDMFNGCTSLTTMPMIKAIEFADGSCQTMFAGCASLVNQWVDENPTVNTKSNVAFTAESVGTDSFRGMFQNTPITDASGIKLNAQTVYARTFRSMFYACTSLTTAPEIKAETYHYDSSDSTNGSFTYMFGSCSNLSYIKVHFTDWHSGNGTMEWTRLVKNTGTFVKPDSLPATKNASGNNSNPHYIPYNWTVTNENPPSTKSFNTVVTSSPLYDERYYIIVGRDGDNYYMLHNSGWNYYAGYNDKTYYDPGTPVTVTDNSVLTVPASTNMSKYIFYTEDGKLAGFNTCFLGPLNYYIEGVYRSGTNMKIESEGTAYKGHWERNFNIKASNNNVLLEWYSGWWLMYGDIYNSGQSGYSSHYLGKAFRLNDTKPASSDWNIMLFEYPV